MSSKRLLTPQEIGLYIENVVRHHFAGKDQEAGEIGFQHWHNETLMPEAVNRWIAEIGNAA